jgi:hypothetical protein
MYGTIARIHPKGGDMSGLLALLDEWNRERRPEVAGVRNSYLFVPDKTPYDRPTAFLVAIFDDEATYRANADDPAQHAWYLRLREQLDDDPDWMDGTYTSA